VKFPFIVRHRHLVATIYGKTDRYPYYRLAYMVDGRRVQRHFATFSLARAEADAKLRNIASGNGALAALSTKTVNSAKFALAKLSDLRRDLAARQTDSAAPLGAISLDDAIAEYVEAKLALGAPRLIEAVTGYLSTVAQVRRVKVRDAVEQFLSDRDARTRPDKPGARPALSLKMATQDRYRLDKLAQAFAMDLCDFDQTHIDLFFKEHLRDSGLRAATITEVRCDCSSDGLSKGIISRATTGSANRKVYVPAANARS
jgi:hypothetical protein